MYLATPFCNITFPEWRWLQHGKPLSFRNSRASRICRPSLWTWERGRPSLRCPYLSHQSSCQLLCCRTDIIISSWIIFVQCQQLSVKTFFETQSMENIVSKEYVLYEFNNSYFSQIAVVANNTWLIISLNQILIYLCFVYICLFYNIFVVYTRHVF